MQYPHHQFLGSMICHTHMHITLSPRAMASHKPQPKLFWANPVLVGLAVFCLSLDKKRWLMGTPRTSKHLQIRIWNHWCHVHFKVHSRVKGSPPSEMNQTYHLWHKMNAWTLIGVRTHHAWKDIQPLCHPTRWITKLWGLWVVIYEEPSPYIMNDYSRLPGS